MASELGDECFAAAGAAGAAGGGVLYLDTAGGGGIGGLLETLMLSLPSRAWRLAAPVAALQIHQMLV